MTEAHAYIIPYLTATFPGPVLAVMGAGGRDDLPGGGVMHQVGFEGWIRVCKGEGRLPKQKKQPVQRGDSLVCLGT